MRHIFFIIICGLTLYSQTDVEKIKKTETIVSKDGIEYFYTINEQETKRAKSFYSILLKKEKPIYKIDKFPLIVANLKEINLKSPFFVLSQQRQDKDSFKLVLFKNVIDLFFKENILSIIQKQIDKAQDNIDNIKIESLYIMTLLHHLSHFTGPSVITTDSDKYLFIDKFIINGLAFVEEIRADMSALTVLRNIVSEELLTENEKYDIYQTYIASLIYKKKSGSDEQKKISLSQLNFFKKQECITRNMLTFKVSIDIQEFEITIIKRLIAFNDLEKKAKLTKVRDNIEKMNISLDKTFNNSIKIISPNGNEKLILGKTLDILWTTEGSLSKIKITLWKDGIQSGLIAKDIKASSGIYKWKIGAFENGLANPGSGYIIRIYEQKAKNFMTIDESDRAFNLKNQ